MDSRVSSAVEVALSIPPYHSKTLQSSLLYNISQRMHPFLNNLPTRAHVRQKEGSHLRGMAWHQTKEAAASVMLPPQRAHSGSRGPAGANPARRRAGTWTSIPPLAAAAETAPDPADSLPNQQHTTMLRSQFRMMPLESTPTPPHCPVHCSVTTRLQGGQWQFAMLRGLDDEMGENATAHHCEIPRIQFLVQLLDGQAGCSQPPDYSCTAGRRPRQALPTCAPQALQGASVVLLLPVCGVTHLSLQLKSSSYQRDSPTGDCGSQKDSTDGGD